jgi:membrane carboxypeptidase/penicillin-binding protein PbpC
MGYTTAAAIGVWVGRTGDAGTAQLPEIDGIQAAGPIWQDMMMLIHETPAYAELLNGPDGRPVAEKFPVPDEVSQQDLCAVTGHRPGRGDTIKDWIVDGQEPTLACTEVDAYEAEQLENALDRLRRGANWANGATSSINQYASMVGRNPVPIEGEDDEEEGSESGSGEGSSDSRNVDDGEQPPIEPLD